MRTEQNALVTHDAYDVNSFMDTPWRSPRYQHASRQVEANRPLEEVERQKLHGFHPDNYLRIKGMLKQDPVAMLSLQALLFSGRLTSRTALVGQKTTLDGLATLASSPTPGNRELLADLVQELACPSAVNQKSKGTCGATTAAMKLLRSNPAEYVRLVVGLNSSDGVQTAAGHRIQRENDMEPGDTRSASQRLLAPALMELANGVFRDYRNSEDRHVAMGFQDAGSGLYGPQIESLLESLYRKPFETQRTTSQNDADAWRRIQGELKKGVTVPVALEWSAEGHHMVLVTRTQQREGREYVQFDNPWGRTEEMSRDDFLKRLKLFIYSRN